MIFKINGINQLVFVMEAQSVFYEAGTEFLNIIFMTMF
jgi:hypothetical protein